MRNEHRRNEHSRSAADLEHRSPVDLSVVVPLTVDEVDPFWSAVPTIEAHAALCGLSWELVIVVDDVDAIPSAPRGAGVFVRAIGDVPERSAAIRVGLGGVLGETVVLAAPSLPDRLVELDSVIERLHDGADIALAWRRDPAEVVPVVRSELPELLACRAGVGRSLSGAHTVTGGFGFADVMRAATLWGLRVDEVATPGVRPLGGRGRLVTTATEHAPRVLGTPV